MGSLLKRNGRLLKRNGHLLRGNPANCKCCCPVDTLKITLAGVDAALCDTCFEYSSGLSRHVDTLSVDGEYELPLLRRASGICEYRLDEAPSASAQFTRYNSSDCSGTGTVFSSNGDVRFRVDLDGDSVVRVLLTMSMEFVGGAPSVLLFSNDGTHSLGDPIPNEAECDGGNFRLSSGGTVTVEDFEEALP